MLKLWLNYTPIFERCAQGDIAASEKELSVADKEVVDVVMQFSDKMPTKGLVRVYNLVHSIIDIEGIFLYF